MGSSGYILVWIELLAAGLLTVAILIAAIARLRSGLARWLVGVVLIAVVLAVTTAMGANLPPIPQTYEYFLSLLIALTVCCAIVVIVGLLSRQHGRPVARGWPVSKLILVWVAAICVHILTIAQLDAAVRATISGLKAEAQLIALAASPSRIPDHENAAPLYRKAFAALQAPDVLRDIQRSDLTEEQYVRENLDAVRESLAQQQNLLVLIRRAAGMSECRFDRDYARPGFDMPVPELSSMRLANRMLRLEALVQLADGKSGAALASVSSMFGIARHASRDSLLLTFLSSAAFHENAAKTLETVLSEAMLTADDLDHVHLDELLSFRQLCTRALFMEEASGLAIFGAIQQRAPNHHPVVLLASPYGAYLRVFFVAREVEEYREGMATYKEIIQQPHHETIKRLEDFHQSPGLFIPLLLHPLKPVFDHTAKAEARHVVALAGLAAARYRANYGSYPSSIEQLTPEFLQAPLMDPYDGRAIKMIKKNGELIFYCVGPDETDDQGVEREDERDFRGDISFRLRMVGAPQ